MIIYKYYSIFQLCVNNYFFKKTIKPEFHFNRLQSKYKYIQNLITITISITVVSVFIKEYLALLKLTIAHYLEHNKTINI